MTLYMRRLDARPPPILGAPWAEPVWDRIEHDVHGLWQFTGDVSTIVCRAAILDGWTREFLSTEPAGQVLHLGCGLDSRPLRVGVPSTCRWVDVDQPEVMESDAGSTTSPTASSRSPAPSPTTTGGPPSTRHCRRSSSPRACSCTSRPRPCTPPSTGSCAEPPRRRWRSTPSPRGRCVPRGGRRRSAPSVPSSGGRGIPRSSRTGTRR
ncbi:class I SAM-dependent methyltransferase [Pseudonocardia sp. ICBG1122]|nr:class I SAM-dependent methyltransferase [Pseudonocardia pini]